MEKKNPVEEARRYVDNAKQTLKDNGEYDSSLKRYGDRKYVRAAGHYLWNAVFTTSPVRHISKNALRARRIIPFPRFSLLILFFGKKSETLKLVII